MSPITILLCLSLLGTDTGPYLHIRSASDVGRYWPIEEVAAIEKSDRIECLVPIPDPRTDPPGLFGQFVIDRQMGSLDASQRHRLICILKATYGDTCHGGLIMGTVPKLVLRIHDQDPPLDMRIWDTYWMFERGGYHVDTYCSDMRVAVIDSLYDLCQELKRGKR